MSCSRCDARPASHPVADDPAPGTPVLLGPDGKGMPLLVSLLPDPDFPAPPLGFQRARVCRNCGAVYCPRLSIPPSEIPRL